MTGRERVCAILNKKPVDKLCWTALVDQTTISDLPVEYKSYLGLDFYKHIGCDVFMLNCWGMPFDFASPELIWPDFVHEQVRKENEKTVQEYSIGRNKLSRILKNGHPMKYPVASIDELVLYRNMWEGAKFICKDDEHICANVTSEIGDDGITTRFWGPSTIPFLLEEIIGVQEFYYLLTDHRQEMDILFDTIHKKHLQAFEILAKGPLETVILCENTSTHYISPDIYRKYNLPHVKDFVDIMHANGKKAIIHMCGHIKNLLPLMKDVEMDGIHALTPPPTGDTPWEYALDVLGEDLIIIGALDPAIWIMDPIEKISETLDQLYTHRLRKAHFILQLFADGISVPLERFMAVAQWMNEKGKP